MDRMHPPGLKLHDFFARASAAPEAIWISRAREMAQVAGPVDQSTARPLDHVLLAVKDNIDVLGFPTTAACPAFSYRPTASSVTVQRLIDAGATVVGKTNLDQFACGLVGTRSPYGEVPNAINPDYVSGGSSSGSAVAVSLGLVDAALGTDTAGSGRVPAAFNNVVGIKPSRGLLSLTGSVPACRHIDCISVFSRTVPGAMAVLLAAAGHDAADPYSSNRGLDPRFIAERPRLGIPAAKSLEFFGDALSARAFERSLELVASLGAVFSPIDLTDMLEVANALYEDAWVAERYNAIAPFFDLHQDKMDPVVRSIIAKGKRFSASDLFSAMHQLNRVKQATLSLWDRIDVLVVPTAPTFPTRQAVREEPVLRNRELGYYTNFVNLLDLAAVAVPSVMRDDQLPFGVTLIGPAQSELRLAELAERIHAASGMLSNETPSSVLANAQAIRFSREKNSTVKVVAVGAHMRGLPLNHQLEERGARLVGEAKTAPLYRLFQLPDSVPPKPGLVRADAGATGHAIDVEVWEMPTTSFGSFVAGIAAPLGIGTIELADGSKVQGFLCESAALSNATEISRFGGWRAFLNHLSTSIDQPPGSPT
jgi:allophanate hydrolase